MDMRRFNGTGVAKNSWSEMENVVLRRRYVDPKVTWAELEELLPRRKRASIQHQASKLGLSRRRTNKCSNDPVIQRLWDLREREGITRDQLAEKLGYAAVLIGRWERGEATPSLQRIKDWCQALGADLKVVYQGTPIGTALAVRPND